MFKYMDIFYLLILGSFIITGYLLVKILYDRQNTFSNIIEADLKEKGMKFISSRNPGKKLPKELWPDYILSYSSTHLGAVTSTSYPVAREVEFRDKDGMIHKSYAYIHFENTFTYKLKRIDWVPDINKLKKT